MAAMVSSDWRTAISVSHQTRSNCLGEYPISNPLTTAASQMPVPVAESTLSFNSTFSTLETRTTGGVRITCWWMPGTGKDGETRRSSVSFTGRVPQAKMARVRISQGTQGLHQRMPEAETGVSMRAGDSFR